VFPIDAPDNAKPVIVKGGHKLLLNGDLAKPIYFDKERAKDGFTHRAAFVQSTWEPRMKVLRRSMPE